MLFSSKIGSRVWVKTRFSDWIVIGCYLLSIVIVTLLVIYRT